MAILDQKNGVYLARFRFAGRQFKRSLKTTDRKDAEAALLEVKRAIHRLTIGMVEIPEGVDPGDFILSGGTVIQSPREVVEKEVPSLLEAMEHYQTYLSHLAESNRRTISVHLGNLRKTLGNLAQRPVSEITHVHLEKFLQQRLQDRASSTVAKERATVSGFFAWLVRQGILDNSPAERLTKVKDRNAPSFRTYSEVAEILERGGLSKEEAWSVWDALYLTPAEIFEILELVKTRARSRVSYMLHATAAYTGMRRGKILRLRWLDVEVDADGLWAKSKKQSRQAIETKRWIDLHPDFKSLLTTWKAGRPKSQYVICDEGVTDPLKRHQAEERFWQPLRGTRWVIPERNNRPKIRFHTYRHSFASNLAAAGIDQRMIDEFMGHTTEAMRKRYRHLFPQHRRTAIESLKYGLQKTNG